MLNEGLFNQVMFNGTATEHVVAGRLYEVPAEDRFYDVPEED